MGKSAAKQGDRISATDSHILVSAGGSALTPLPFSGIVNGGLSNSVRISGQYAATVGSTADNLPPHLAPPGTSFKTPPSNRGTIQRGSGTVRINGKAAARNGDPALTCNDPTDQSVGQVVASGNVAIGG